MATKKTISKSSINGRIVSPKYAASHKSTTYTTKVPTKRGK